MEMRDSNYQAPEMDGPPSSVTALIQNITSNISVFGYNDEYDPARPNDYEKLKEKRKREQNQRDPESERPRRDEVEPKGLYDDDEEDDNASGHHSREASERNSRKGNVFAPPPSLIEEDKRATTNPNETGSSSRSSEKRLSRTHFSIGLQKTMMTIH
jgi:hypothetical protein